MCDEGRLEFVVMNWFKKHVDTVIVMGGIISSVLWMNHKFTQIDTRFSAIDLRFAELEKDMAVMKAVLFMQGHFPKELVAKVGEE